MSCYLASKDDAIITAVWSQRESYGPAPRREYVQQSVIEIWRTNVASIEGRYPGKAGDIHETRNPDMIYWGPNDVFVTDGLIAAALAMHPLTVHMVARCVDYQSCEFDGYENTAGGKAMQRALEKSAYVAASAHSERTCGGGWPVIELQDSGAEFVNRKGERKPASADAIYTQFRQEAQA